MTIANAIRFCLSEPYGANPTNQPWDGRPDTSAVPVLPAIDHGMTAQAAAGAAGHRVAHVAAELPRGGRVEDGLGLAIPARSSCSTNGARKQAIGGHRRRRPWPCAAATPPPVPARTRPAASAWRTRPSGVRLRRQRDLQSVGERRRAARVPGSPRAARNTRCTSGRARRACRSSRAGAYRARRRAPAGPSR